MATRSLSAFGFVRSRLPPAQCFEVWTSKKHGSTAHADGARLQLCGCNTSSPEQHFRQVQSIVNVPSLASWTFAAFLPDLPDLLAFDCFLLSASEARGIQVSDLVRLASAQQALRAEAYRPTLLFSTCVGA